MTWFEPNFQELFELNLKRFLTYTRISNWLTEFNSMPTYLCIHFMFIFRFFCSCFLKAFFFGTWFYQIQISLNRSIWPIDEIPISIANNLSQSEPESNDNERIQHTLQKWSLTIRCSLVSYSIYHGGVDPSAEGMVSIF